MAGSSMRFTYKRSGEYCKIVADWVSDSSSGAVSATMLEVFGELVRGVTLPGSPAPADNYNAVLTDPDGLDLLALSWDDLLARHTTNDQQVYLNLKPDATTVMPAYPVSAGAITLSIDTAGNSKAGQVILYVRGGIAGLNLLQT